MAVRRRKKETTTTQKEAPARRRKRRDEEPEVVEEDQVTEEEFDDEDEDDDDFGSEVISGGEAKALNRSEWDLPADGDWELTVTNVTLVKPNSETGKWGGALVTFNVDAGPIDEPEDGFGKYSKMFLPPSKSVRPYPKGTKLTDGQKTRLRMGRQEAVRFLTACLGEFDESGEYAWFEDLFKACEGATIIVTAVTKGDFQNLRNYRPVE
ncbi:MAG: hypothetical protein Q9N26_08130 [Aquificota bacterium]|nr:hypothetical protein [Aquificota bacterium]